MGSPYFENQTLRIWDNNSWKYLRLKCPHDIHMQYNISAIVIAHLSTHTELENDYQLSHQEYLYIHKTCQDAPRVPPHSGASTEPKMITQ